MNNVVVVFTSEPISVLLSKAGTGDWTANISKLSLAKYVLCVHNSKNSSFQPHSQGNLEHGQAFFIGLIKQISPAEEQKKFIELSEYATLPNTDACKAVWERLANSQRNPITYKSIEKVLEVIEVDLNELQWKSDFKQLDSQVEHNVDSTNTDLPTLINAMREKIAKVAKVSKDKVSIKIEF